MDYSRLLQIISLPVVASWALLLFAPRWKGTRLFLHSDVVPLAIAVVYAAAIWPLLPGVLRQFDTFAHIQQAFTNPALVFAGWIHYLAFDLMIGRLIVADSQQRGIPHLWVAPCLPLTFMLGPLGYLAYAGVRLLRGQISPAVAPLSAGP